MPFLENGIGYSGTLCKQFAILLQNLKFVAVKAIFRSILSGFSALVLSLILMSGSLHYLSHSSETEHCTHLGESHLHESSEPCGLCDYHFSNYHFFVQTVFYETFLHPANFFPAGTKVNKTFFSYVSPGRAPPVKMA